MAGGLQLPTNRWGIFQRFQQQGGYIYIRLAAGRERRPDSHSYTWRGHPRNAPPAAWRPAQGALVFQDRSSQFVYDSAFWRPALLDQL